MLNKNCIVLQPALRNHALSTIHSAHQGITSINAPAEATIFRPRQSSAFRAIRVFCQYCNGVAPLYLTHIPHLPLHQTLPYNSYLHLSIIERSTEGGTGFIKCLRRTFIITTSPMHYLQMGGPHVDINPTISQDFGSPPLLDISCLFPQHLKGRT